MNWFKKKTLVQAIIIDHPIHSVRDKAESSPIIIQKRPTLVEAAPSKSEPTSLFRWVDKAIVIIQKRFRKKTLGQQIIIMPNKPISKARKRTKKDLKNVLKISLLGIGFSLGGLYYYPFMLVGGALLLYNSLGVHLQTYNLLKQGKITVDIFASLTVLGATFSGYILLGHMVVLIFLSSFVALSMVQIEAKSQLVDVFKQLPKEVWILVDGVEMQIPFTKLEPGHVVVVQGGETIPADGVVIEGVATVDQHILTGEARPVERGAHDPVFASTVVLSGRILLQVERAGQATTVAQIGIILNKTTDFKSNLSLRAESLGDQTVKPTLLLAMLALPLVGPSGTLAVCNAHFRRKMTFLTPISLLNYFNIASGQGILIKDGRSLDLLHEVDTLVFDKTGTLTEEMPHVGAVYAVADFDEDTVLKYAAASEYKQTHPIALAIIEAAEKKGLELPATRDGDYKLGYGLTTFIENQQVRVGSNRFMELVNLTIPSILKETQAICYEQGHSLIMVALDEQIIGAIELLPTLRPEAKEVIRQLKQRPNIKYTYIISGDNEIPTRKLAHELGIDHCFAETLPEQKADLIAQLQQEGKSICYIGDGINDAIALKRANVSISLKGASTIATDTAQIILLSQGLQHLNFLFDLADDFYTNVNRTFNIVIVPTIIGISGVFLFGYGLAFTIPLNFITWGIGLSNAMMPRRKYQHLLGDNTKGKSIFYENFKKFLSSEGDDE